METTLNDKLPAFQKYLMEKNLAPAKNVPFYAHWVSRFLDYARRNEFSALEYQEAAVRGQRMGMAVCFSGQQSIC